MKNLRTIFLNRILALVLTIVALMTGQEAWAVSNWTVQYTSHDDQTNVTTFTVTRKDKTYAQTVRYRTLHRFRKQGHQWLRCNLWRQESWRTEERCQG